MEWLQTVLANAVYLESGMLDLTATMKKINEEAPKHIIPKEQYNNKAKELDAANDTIKNLKKNNEDNDALQGTIKTHESAIKQLKLDHEAEVKSMKIDGAIAKVLTDYKAKHPDLLSGKVDREKLQITTDGKVIGLDEQMKGLKDTYKDLFTQTVSGATPANPDSQARGNTTFETLVNSADTMTADEVAASFAAMEKQ